MLDPDRRLWLCLHYPTLSLDMLCRGAKTTAPIAISESAGQRHTRVHSLNSSAREAGIRIGMSTSEAHALHAGLHLSARNPARETNTLKRLADFCFQYTTQIVLAPPHSLSLEIGGSLRLFAGLDPLLDQIRKDMDGLGFHYQIGVAPLPCAAELLARAGISTPVTRRQTLSARLGILPIECLLLPGNAIDQLLGFGFKKISDLYALQENHIRDRLADKTWTYLRRLYGAETDTRPRYHAAEQFQSRIELPAMAHTHDALLFACQRLLKELAGFLQARECGVQSLQFTLQHPPGESRRSSPEIHNKQRNINHNNQSVKRNKLCDLSSTTSHLELHLSAVSRTPQHWLHLLTETLSRQQLRAPVEAIELHTAKLLEYRPTSSDLFADGPNPTQAQQLLEILTARLGQKAVQRIHARADHRPECAWSSDPGNQKIELPLGNRPLWLLPRPRPLNDAPPTLQILAGPERLESGWWDGCDAKRDYYIARTGKGRRLWVYRELTKNRRWFIHGIFA